MSGTNRYIQEMGGSVAEYEQILTLSPAHVPLRQVVALEIADAYQPGMRIYDLGCGWGHSTVPIMQHLPDAPFAIVDEDENAVSSTVNQLLSVNDRGLVRLIVDDLVDFLRDDLPCYDEQPKLLTSSWTIHNFDPEIRSNVLYLIAQALHPGETFVWMDKIYPNVYGATQRSMLEQQNELYGYLHYKLAKKMIAHEHKDFNIRMQELSTVQQLDLLGFDVKIGPRVEREIVLVCTKR